MSPSTVQTLWTTHDVRPLPRRDRAWRDTDVVWALGEQDVPDVDAVRAALVDVGRCGRGGKLVRLLDPDRAESSAVALQDLPSLAERIIASDPTPWSVGIDTLAEAERGRPLDGLPLRLTLGPTWTTLRFNHALGDVSMLWPIYRALSRAEELHELGERTVERPFPLRDALRHTFGSDPRRLWTALQAPRGPLPVAADPAGLTGVEQAVASAVSATGYRKGIRGDITGAALPAIMLARTFRAAADLGLRAHPGVAMVADCRRYLPSREPVLGNFCAGSYVPLADPLDPVAINTTLDRLTASARPLLSMTLMAARAGRKPVVQHPWAEDPEQRTLISYSHVGRLPWAKGARQPGQLTGLGRALGCHGLSIITAEINSRLCVSVNFDPNYIERSLAVELADRLVAFG